MGNIQTLYCGKFQMTDLCGDMLIELTVINKWDDEVTAYINKDQGIKIIQHLQAQFNLK